MWGILKEMWVERTPDEDKFEGSAVIENFALPAYLSC
jgi:hypothetical protein